jgi:ABC-type transport system substrate-binding protein
MYNESMRKGAWKIEAGSRSYVVNDPDAMYTDTVTCDGNANKSQLCNPKIDELVKRQSQEIDEKKRIALINELETIVLSQYGTFPMYFRNRFRMYPNNVHGWGLHPNEDNVMHMEDCWKS